MPPDTGGSNVKSKTASSSNPVHEIQETDDVAWYALQQRAEAKMKITHGPAEKMIRAYLRLLNKHIDNV